MAPTYIYVRSTVPGSGPARGFLYYRTRYPVDGDRVAVRHDAHKIRIERGVKFLVEEEDASRHADGNPQQERGRKGGAAAGVTNLAGYASGLLGGEP